MLVVVSVVVVTTVVIAEVTVVVVPRRWCRIGSVAREVEASSSRSVFVEAVGSRLSYYFFLRAAILLPWWWFFFLFLSPTYSRFGRAGFCF